VHARHLALKGLKYPRNSKFYQENKKPNKYFYYSENIII